MSKLNSNTTKQVDDILQHFGIPGMHWGRHKISSINAKREANRSDDDKTKRELQKKKVHQMSNVELKRLNERLQLEKQYKDLSKTDISAGRKFVTDLLTGSAKQVLSNILTDALTKGAKLAVSTAITAARK